MAEDAPRFTEAEERFALRLAEDLGRILGTGLLIEELELSPMDDGPARVRALVLFDGGTETLEAEGSTTLEAYNRLVTAAAQLRLAIASRRMIAPI